MKTNSTDSNRPQIGMVMMVRNQKCRIVKIHKFGTVDVETIDGTRAYRVTGLPFI